MLVLITDGVPRCIDPTTSRVDQPERIGALLTKIREELNVNTFVLGLAVASTDGMPSFFEQALNTFAEAGGTALPGEQKYYPGNAPEDLETALRGITLSATNCVFDLPELPSAARVNSIELDGTVLSDEDWVLASDGTQVQLGSAPCADVRSGSVVSIRARVECGAPSTPTDPVELF